MDEKIWKEGYCAKTQLPPKGKSVLGKWKRDSNGNYNNVYGNNWQGSEWGRVSLMWVNSSGIPTWGDDDYFCSSPERWWPLPDTDTKPA